MLIGPDAALRMLRQRASCVLNRFDFLKPVGWHSMAPILDGAYSIECYMECTETREGRDLGQMPEAKPFILIYNVFRPNLRVFLSMQNSAKSSRSRGSYQKPLSYPQPLLFLNSHTEFSTCVVSIPGSRP